MFWKSKGFARGFGVLLNALAFIPALEPYREILLQVGTALGVVGVANATLK